MPNKARPEKDWDVGRVLDDVAHIIIMETEREFYERMKDKWGPFSPILVEWEERLNGTQDA